MIASWFQKAGAVDFPAPVTVGAVVKEDFVEFLVVIQARPVSCEFCKSGRNLVVGIGTQNIILVI